MPRGARIIRVGVTGINGAPLQALTSSLPAVVTGCRGARRLVFGLKLPAQVLVANCTVLAQPANNITRATGSFVADGVVVGALISGTGITAGSYVTAVAPLVLTISTTPTAGGPLSMTFYTASVAITPNFSLGEDANSLGNEGGALGDYVASGWAAAATPTAGKWLTGSLIPIYGAGFFEQDAFRLRCTWTGTINPIVFVSQHFDSDPPEFVDIAQPYAP